MSVDRWTEGICGDGAAILHDGVMVPIEDFITQLNRLDHIMSELESRKIHLLSKNCWCRPEVVCGE